MRGPGLKVCRAAPPSDLDIRCNKDSKCGSPSLPAREWSLRCADGRAPACSLPSRPPGRDTCCPRCRKRKRLCPAQSPADSGRRFAADISVQELEFRGGWSRLGFYRTRPRSLLTVALDRRIDNFAHLRSQMSRREWFLQECCSRRQHAALFNDVIGVAGDEQHFHLRSQGK